MSRLMPLAHDTADAHLDGLSDRKRPVLLFVVLLLAAFCLTLATTAAYGIWSARRHQIKETEVATSNVARLLAVQAESALRTADLTLLDVVERVERDGATGEPGERLAQHLRNVVATAPVLTGVFVYDERGEWTATSLPRPQAGNNADRSYFQFHRTHPGHDLHLDMPVRSKSTGLWIIPVSRRIDHPDGSFAGVALATLRVDFFEQLYASLDIGEAGSILFMLDSGTLLYRRPFRPEMVGTDVANGPIIQMYRAQGAMGTAIRKSPIDGKERLYSYRHLNSFPLIVAMTQSKDEFLHRWRIISLLAGGATIVVIGVLVWLGRRVVRQIRVREQLEGQLRDATISLRKSNAELQAIASSDGLTGLANRRHFDEALALELKRARRTGAALSLVMIDVDHFKKFNDGYGHVAGDECLKRVAAVMSGEVMRPGDLAARYGGEEFALILPDTDLGGALAVAEKIRSGIIAMQLPHRHAPDAVVTASFGVCTVQAALAQLDDPAVLVRAADQFLYEAKTAGRNRVAGREFPQQATQDPAGA